MTGVIISGVAGLAWAQWAAGGLPRGASVGVRIASAVVGLAIVARAARRRRAAAGSSWSMFRDRGYRIVVLAEVVAVVVAVLVLVSAGATRYVPVAVAAIVGVHFLGFGRLFQRLYYLLGAGLLLAGLTGLLIGLGHGHSRAIVAATGLIAAAVLFIGALTRLAVDARDVPDGTPAAGRS